VNDDDTVDSHSSFAAGFRPISRRSFTDDLDDEMRRRSPPPDSSASSKASRYGSFDSYQNMDPADGTEGQGYNCIDFDRWEAEEELQRRGQVVQNDYKWLMQWFLLAIVGIGIGLTCFLINFGCAGLYAIKANQRSR